MKCVVYTCLFASTSLKVDTPSIKNKIPNWDYIIFTNIPDKLEKSEWQPIYKDVLNNQNNVNNNVNDMISCVYTAKHYKWLAHKYLCDYDIAIWVDSYLTPKHDADWNSFITQINDTDINCAIIQMAHWKHPCIYAECDYIVQCKKDISKNMNMVKNLLTEKGMPKNYGLPETKLSIRHLKNDSFNKACEELIELMTQFTYRDQALVSYIFWKHGIKFNFGFNKEYYVTSGQMGDHTYVTNNGTYK